MKVTFDISYAGETPELTEIFKALSITDKKEIATTILKEWLEGDFDLERQLKERELINAYLKQHPNETEERARRSWDFSRGMEEFISAKDKMIKSLVREMKNEIHDHVINVLKGDTYSDMIKNAVRETMEKEMPKMVVEALIQSYANSFHDKVMENENNSANIGRMAEDILRKIEN